MNVLTTDEAIRLGMGRSANTGNFSTGKVGGGQGTVLVQAQPELIIGVPAGYCIKPLSVYAQVQTGVTTADADETEILVAVDSLGYYAGDGTFTVVDPSNLRTDLDKGSACRVAQAVTANCTTTPGYGVIAAAAPVLDMEIDRVVSTASFQTAVGIYERIVELHWNPKHPPYLVGPCSLCVYFGGTRATIGGFVQAQWVEGKTSDLLPAI